MDLKRKVKFLEKVRFSTYLKLGIKIIYLFCQFICYRRYWIRIQKKNQIGTYEFGSASFNITVIEDSGNRDSVQEKIKSLENSKEYLEKSVKESENNLRELISHKKSAS